MPLDPLEITGGLAIGTGLGGAIEDTVKPRLENFRKSQWQAHPDRALDPGVAAEVAAENFASFGAMTTEASYNGYDANRFQHLYDVTLTGPGMGELLAMLRRGTISAANFTHGMQKAKLEPMWHGPLANLANVVIPGPDLAYMVVRGAVPDGGTLPSSLPTRADNLALPAQLNIDPILEASKTGWDQLRFAALVARSGLAMAPVMAAQAYFRGILTKNDYDLTIARGDLFPAYADPVLQASRQILTAGEYAELELRGFYTTQQRRNQTAQHGMATADSDDLYNVKGRAPNIHAVTTGLARGGKYNGKPQSIPQPYLDSVSRQDIRPEWYDIEYANRYLYPSAFVLRSLAQAGDLGGQKQVEQVLLEIGWNPSFAQQVSTAWTGGGTTVGPHVTKAQNQLWTTAHKSYVGEMVDAATVTPALNAAGVTGGGVAQVLALWDHERALIRKQLTPAQVKKAMNDGIYTQPQALQLLLDRGYSQADATVLLAE